MKRLILASLTMAITLGCGSSEEDSSQPSEGSEDTNQGEDSQ